jgi:hypothetical protein
MRRGRQRVEFVCGSDSSGTPSRTSTHLMHRRTSLDADLKLPIHWKVQTGIGQSGFGDVVESGVQPSAWPHPWEGRRRRAKHTLTKNRLTSCFWSSNRVHLESLEWVNRQTVSQQLLGFVQLLTTTPRLANHNHLTTAELSCRNSSRRGGIGDWKCRSPKHRRTSAGLPHHRNLRILPRRSRSAICTCERASPVIPWPLNSVTTSALTKRRSRHR